MLTIISWFAIVMCALNWLIFLLLTFKEDLPQLRRVVDELVKPLPTGQERPAGVGNTVQQSGIDPGKLAAATGTLAGAFKKAGAAPTAAAMSLVCLLIALIAAGVNKL